MSLPPAHVLRRCVLPTPTKLRYGFAQLRYPPHKGEERRKNRSRQSVSPSP
jgi:hypothetical protein